MSDLLRAPAEIKYAEELDWLEMAGGTRTE